MASRSLDDLRPDVAAKTRQWLTLCEASGVHPLIYCTYRTPDEQAKLYAIGRTVPGKIVTNARAWESWHQYRRAFDAVPLIHGKPSWSVFDSGKRLTREYQVMAEAAVTVGLEWAGTWKSFREYVHFQDRGDLSMAQARAEVDDEGTA